MKVAVIGTGSMGRNHVRLYSDIEDVELVAISDTDQKAVEVLAQKFQTKAYTDYKEMLDKEEIDAVSIVVPTSFHKEVTLYAISKGINVLLEKPIASSEEEADEIIAAAKEKGVIMTVGHIERFNPAIISMKKRIENGDLGKIFKISIDRVGPFPARIRDVGVVIDLAVHDIDILNYLTEAKITRLYAETEKNIHTDHEDLLDATIKYDNGTIASLNINWLTPTKMRRIYVTGEKGMYVADYITQDLYFYENYEAKINNFNALASVIEGQMTKFHINKSEPLRNEIIHFIECAKENRQPLVTGKNGKAALMLAKKLIESSKTNEVIKL